MRHESANIRSAEEVLAKVEADTEVVGIDEGQFFDNDLVDVATQLAGRGVRVIIAGLDQDYTGKPWEPMPQLLAIAEYITKTHAICMKCGQPANYSQRTFESDERVAVGATGMYEARCRKCFVPHADAPTVHPD
jgi:thymidine kinase